MANTEKFIIAFDQAFKAAVERKENFNDEGINWDFVDADLNMDLGDFYSAEYLYECLDVLVNNYFE